MQRQGRTKAETIAWKFSCAQMWHRNISGLLSAGSNLTNLERTVSLNHPTDRRVVSSLKRKGFRFAQTAILFVNRRTGTEIPIREAGSRDPAGRRCLVSDDALDARFAGGAARVT